MNETYIKDLQKELEPIVASHGYTAILTALEYDAAMRAVRNRDHDPDLAAAFDNKRAFLTAMIRQFTALILTNLKEPIR